MPDTPLTILFTDIEGSSSLWERDPERMRPALARHDRVVRDAIGAWRGRVVKMLGDGVHAVFDDPLDALQASVQMQRVLQDEEPVIGLPLRIRCGLHTGEVERRDDDYFGAAVNRAARIMNAAHGGQVLVSQVVAGIVGTSLPRPILLRDLGRVRLRGLSAAERVYQVVHPMLREDFPALRSLESAPSNLPLALTSFVGRERERAELATLMASNRLVTLSGAGGCGKTRLGLQSLLELAEPPPDGVWLVELAQVQDGALVAGVVASTLGLREEPGRAPLDALVAHLSDRHLVLFLDNCEHLLDACARVVETILARCRGVRILASSREALGLAGELAYRVASLSVPTGDRHTLDSVMRFESAQLFVERARLARSDYTLADDDAATLASICSRLDGIPLAIELAAARMRSMSLVEIDRRLNACFRLLTGGSRTALPRQQTLRAAIDWSYELLDDALKAVFRRLAAFAGGWRLDAAEGVCAGDGVDADRMFELHVSLCDKNLVSRHPEDGRYRFVETVRQYAQERLAETPENARVRDRHLDHCVRLAEEANANLSGPEQAAWLRRLEDEHDNLRVALGWSFDGSAPAQGVRLCAALQRFWLMHGHLSEGRAWFDRALACEAAAEPAPLRASLLAGAGNLAFHQHDYRAARVAHEQCLAIRRAAGDRKGIAASLNNLGMLALDEGDLDGARACHEQSLAIARELDERNRIARSLANLALVACYQRDPASARDRLDESLRIARDLGDLDLVASNLHMLGMVARDSGDADLAEDRVRQSLAIFRELGHKLRIAYSLEMLAVLGAARDDAVRSGRLFGAAERLRETIGMPRADEDAEFGADLAAARRSFAGDPAFDRSWQEGRGLDVTQAVEYALAEEAARAAR
jgi:predicted ATPase/class 3 adenylate cyclase